MLLCSLLARVYNLQGMASDQLRGSAKGGSDNDSMDAKTAVAGESGHVGATRKETSDAAADDPDTAKVAVSSDVSDFLNHLKTSGESRPNLGRYGGVVEENTLDIDGDELEEMRVETEQVAISPPDLPPKIPRKETGDETTAVGFKGRVAPQDTKVSIRWAGDGAIDSDDDSDDQNVGDITAVTDLNANANLDATDILSKRLDESPEPAAGDIVATGKPSQEPSTARAKTVELRPEERAATAQGAGAAGQEEMDPAMKEALASNPLASSRGTSLPNTATQIVVPNYHADDEDFEESLAQMISQVRYRPPTKLAAIGSSIVLAAVAAFGLAGDGSADAVASDEIATKAMASNEATPAVQPEVEPADPPASEGGSIEEPPGEVGSANKEAIEAARKAASEKAEAERRAVLEAEEEAAAAENEEEVPEDATEESTEEPVDDPAATDPEETDPEESSEETVAVDEADADAPEEIMDFEVEPEEEIEPTPKTTGPASDRAPKPSKKQQRAAAKALNQKATVAFMQGKLSASEKGFKAALKADPSLATSHRGLGLVYERRGSKKRAAAALRRYLKQAPRAKDAAAIRARLERLGN